jgi:hypothetical protein
MAAFKAIAMKMPTIQGVIDRRMLINFTADPAIVQGLLPDPFRPKIYKGKAIVGICLIRLKNIRPKGFPAITGIGSENAAHRIAVEWTENGKTREGVYIPRRDSSSILNKLAGGRIFPGKHFLAKFDVREADGHYHIAFKSSDNTSISVDAEKTSDLEKGSIFETLNNASAFFEKGATGFSPKKNQLEGITLHTFNWLVEPLHVTAVYSSFFQNKNIFPEGSIKFDNALLMTEVKHEWHTVGKKQIPCCI